VTPEGIRERCILGSEDFLLKTVHLIAAARPNFMKVAPLYHAMRKTDWIEPSIVHTGQHYDANMSDAFFRDLRMPNPHYHLEVGSGTHAEQTGGVMIAYEKVAMEHRPDWIVVVGDVNSTVACALVGAKLGIRTVHLEAGLRSGDRTMPEEINRLATDAICDVYWTPSSDANEHLRREGIDPAKIDFVGNIMIDSYEMMREAIEADGTRDEMDLKSQRYGVVTLHRPANVDNQAVLRGLVAQLTQISTDLPLVFAVHPRTRKRLQEFALLEALERCPAITLTEPLGYVQFMNLVASAAAVVTDSGGVQEETTYLGIPCLTLRENTERPVTVTEGSNRLVPPAELGAALQKVLAGKWNRGRRPELWDGQTAARCVVALARRTATSR
jgi:UDP-N-acetylglucosamine 2-epimerase (non-hydrolysing)